MSRDEIEARIKRAKALRDRLVSDRAEKIARQKSAQEKLEKLKAKARSNGFEIEDLPMILDQKRSELTQKLTEFENTLADAEARLSAYDE